MGSNSDPEKEMKFFICGKLLKKMGFISLFREVCKNRNGENLMSEHNAMIFWDGAIWVTIWTSIFYHNFR